MAIGIIHWSSCICKKSFLHLTGEATFFYKHLTRQHRLSKISSRNQVFECVCCGNCCRWSGCVKLEDSKIDAIADFLAMKVEEFIDQFTELMPDRQGLTLAEKPDGSCIFLTNENTCQINPVKPRQCGDFPQRWNFPGWEKECGGAKKS
ncbi:MAG: YkgJ family cysteine cluster protein [Victivallales bacterium]|nr:YkgJ family cysteine cluster protein [Victivallales bacterium]